MCKDISIFYTNIISFVKKTNISIHNVIYNGLAVWLVADFEALSYRVTTNFDTSSAALIRTVPAINYTACYRLVFCLPVLQTIVIIQ
ncbi:MAG TPA: hypothetical protein PLC59_09960, partial [Bacteroidales bacterium]|nr:hypothetical protein [Bacteroidales bacterium]